MFYKKESRPTNPLENESLSDLLKIEIFHAGLGELGIHCETPELSVYLQKELGKIKGSGGIQDILKEHREGYQPIEAGFRIYSASNKLNEDTFYIKGTSFTLERQQDNTSEDIEEFKRQCDCDDEGNLLISPELQKTLKPTELEELEKICKHDEKNNIIITHDLKDTLRDVMLSTKEKLNINGTEIDKIEIKKDSIFYGAYAGMNDELSLACPNRKGLEKVIELLNLPQGTYESFGSNSIYFNENILPFDKGSKKTLTVLIRADILKQDEPTESNTLSR